MANLVETAVYELFKHPRTYTAQTIQLLCSEVRRRCRLWWTNENWHKRKIMVLGAADGAGLDFIRKFSLFKSFVIRHLFWLSWFTKFCLIKPKYFCCAAKQFAKFSGISSMTSLETMYNTNFRRLRLEKPDGPNYVAFLAPRKLKTNGKVDDFHLPLHMCAVVIREKEKQRHGKKD